MVIGTSLTRRGIQTHLLQGLSALLLVAGGCDSDAADASANGQGDGTAAVGGSSGEPGSNGEENGQAAPGDAASGTGGSDDAGDGLAEDDCCSAHGGLGCADPAVEACMCDPAAGDPSCCDDAWDAVCVDLIEPLGCGQCQNDCCAASTSPGCNDPTVEACVCEKDPGCCDDAWDEFCVMLMTTETLGSTCGTCE